MIRRRILKTSGLYSIVSNVNIINNKQYSRHKLGIDIGKTLNAKILLFTYRQFKLMNQVKDLSTVS